MNDSRITRRGFLTKAAAVAALPFVASALSSCSEDLNSPAVTSEPAMSSFDSILNSKETVSIKTLEKIGNGKRIKLSNSLFYEPTMNSGNYLVMLKYLSENGINLQLIQVKAVESTDSYKIIEGLPTDVELFEHPGDIIREMAKINKSELKKKFRRIQLLKGGR